MADLDNIKIIKENLIISNCDKFIKMINENILTTKLDDEETALFLKVKADHYRYLAEITQGHQLYINKQNAFHFYKEAYLKAENFDDLNSTKLNIALNYSVFLYEILNKRINSFFYAKEALYKALRALKNCDEEELTNEEMRDTLMIIEVLNRNVEDWYKEEVGDIFESAKERIAFVISSLSSPGITCPVTSVGKPESFSRSTGVKVSRISPFLISLPVVTIPTFFCW